MNGKQKMTLCARIFQRSVSPHALAGSLCLESEAALMPQLGPCTQALHSRAYHLSRCMRGGPESRCARLRARSVPEHRCTGSRAAGVFHMRTCTDLASGSTRCQGPTRRQSPRAWPRQWHASGTFFPKRRSRRSFCVRVVSSQACLTVTSSNRWILLDSRWLTGR